ncbi:O-antigen ligase family protein [Lentisphaera marina]|uniref:O-antigen ligase family protein n=1 Tax=Lentisphaera marina TaxID=1111041 RepID=UPI002366844A|nr:O-antigen ligase family protein [Lentisphaera marina]MDD7985420.1 O-antigen ligase family protein [Lentisphaera marina]
MAERVLVLCISLLLFFCPLYFGLNFGQNAVELSPLDLFSWIYTSAWPLQILTIASLLCLIFTVVVYPQRSKNELRQSYFLVPWFALILALFPGGIRTTEKAFLNQYISHVVMVFALALSVWIIVNQKPKMRLMFLGAIFCGSCKSIFNGLYQYFYGFQQNVQSIEQSSSVNLGDFKGRAQETLLYADFVLSNSYAAHLVLVFGVFLYMTRHILNSFIADNKRVLLWTVIFMMPLISCLILTRSRGAFVAFFIATLITLSLNLTNKKKYSIWLSVFLLSLVSLPTLSKIGSVIVRGEYARVSLSMLSDKPLGAGIGEFRNDYLLGKIPGAEGAVLPHSMSMTLLGQCGIPGLLAFLLFMASFIYIIRILDKGKWTLNHFILWGLLAWFIHAQLDFNFFIPGTLATFAVMLALIERPKSDEQILGKKTSTGINIVILCLSVSVFLFVKDMYSLHRFSLTHDKFFGGALIDYRFAKVANNDLSKCDYCLEELQQDNLAYCVSCGVLGDPSFLSAEMIVKECEVLDELMERPDIWKMASKKLMIMYFRQKYLLEQGVAVDKVAMEQYLLESERSMEKAIKSEPRYGLNYLSLAELQFQRKKSPQLVMSSLADGLALSPDSRRGHNMVLRYGDYYRRLGFDFKRQELLSHIQLSEISMAGIRFNLRQGRKLSEEQEKQLFELSAKMKQLNLFLLREFKDDEELLGQYEKVTKLLEQLKERV